MTREKNDVGEANLHLEIDRGDPGTTRLREEPLAELRDGQVRLRVDRFAVTANNVTYASVGDALGYWDFFPAESGWGRVPAMGWGEVVASAHPDVAVGGRYYGWFPMSRSLDLSVSPSESGLRDEGEQRAAHAPVYRTYTATDRDPFHAPGDDAEDRHALLRGLFLTAFLADDFLAEHGYFGASSALVLSASSKTAIGFAQCAADRGLDALVGVTSPANLDFVSGLGWYDRVVAYPDVASIPADVDSVAIDLAGDGALLSRIHAHLGDRLRYSMSIGLSHHGAPSRPASLPGPKPEFFFAPSQVSQRMRDWGPEGYRQRVAEALRRCVDASRGWLEVSRSYGPAAAQQTWLAVLGGQVPPSIGRIASLWEARAG